MPHWAVVGASRGIGLEFVKQLVARGDNVTATVRGDLSKASNLWTFAGSSDQGSCRLLECDVKSDLSISRFANDLAYIHGPKTQIDYVIINAGILKYPNRVTEITFDDFADHLHTNTIGPILVAQKLLATHMSIGSIVFMSSDSGSALNFRAFEDGFAAYAASKAALNQALRHMAAELQRENRPTVIMAMHPGEVATDMANISLDWDVEGTITPEQSVSGMIPVIESKDIRDTGTFYTWEGKEHPW